MSDLDSVATEDLLGELFDISDDENEEFPRNTDRINWSPLPSDNDEENESDFLPAYPGEFEQERFDFGIQLSPTSSTAVPIQIIDISDDDDEARHLWVCFFIRLSPGLATELAGWSLFYQLLVMIANMIRFASVL